MDIIYAWMVRPQPCRIHKHIHTSQKNTRHKNTSRTHKNTRHTKTHVTNTLHVHIHPNTHKTICHKHII